MEPNEIKDKDWEKIKRIFFQSSPLPKISETFTYQVIEKIERKESFSFSDFVKWFAPTFSLMCGSIFLISVVYHPIDNPFLLESLNGTSPFMAQELAEFQSEAGSDWTGLEAL